MSETNATITDFIEELRWRGLLHQCTDEDALREHLETPGRTAYIGFDPTADSLTVGNLVPIMMLVHFQRAGHTPIALMGGGTGLIGDPSGKSAERQLRTEDEIAANVAAQSKIFANVFSEANGLKPIEVKNNLDWLRGLGYIEALRDVGKHFSVNQMMQKDSVRERLHNREQGISYTEFSYMILQSYDFAELFMKQGISLQMGGSDQWGNITEGVELIRKYGTQRLAIMEATDHELIEGDVTEERRAKLQHDHDQAHSEFMAAGGYTKHDREAEINRLNTPGIESLKRGSSHDTPRTGWQAFGLTAPLVTKADGGKFGKTEAGAIWLSAERTSPYAIYQWCINTADEDVARFLKLFTLLTKEDIEAIEQEHAEAPGRRLAQTRFAEELVRFLHGSDALTGAQAASKALFSGDVKGLDEHTLREVFEHTPSSEMARSRLDDAGLPIMEALTETNLAKSNREAKEFLAGGSVSVNGEKADADRALTPADLLPGQVIVLRRGKKAWHQLRFV